MATDAAHLTAPSLLPRPASVAVFALLAASVATAMPLVAYAGSLALFGLPHVLAELRYVDGRFGRRLPGSQVAALVGLLGLAVGLRALGLVGAIDTRDSYVAELGVVAIMAFVALPDLVATPLRALVALLVGASLALGSWLAPLLTLVLLAVLHNLTPIGFLLERTTGSRHRRQLGWSLPLLFLGIPLLLATGWPAAWLNQLGLFDPDATFGSVGALGRHRGVFVPEPVLATSWATPLFTAVTYLQLMHYGAVLLVLPRLLAPAEGGVDRPRLPWPRARVLGLVIAAIGLVAAVSFVRDFRGTRTAYGLIAAVHAWIEIPLLLLALSPLLTRPRATQEWLHEGVVVSAGRPKRGTTGG